MATRTKSSGSARSTPDRPKVSRAQKTREVQEAITASALELLAANGVDGLALTKIAAHAGMSNGPLYGRYDSAEDVALELWDSVLGNHFKKLILAFDEFSSSLGAEPSEWLLNELTKPSALTSGAVEIVAAAAGILRLACEDVAIRLYPLRSRQVQLPATQPPARWWRFVTIGIRSAIVMLVITPFIGFTWVTIAIAGLLAVPLVIRLWEVHLPNVPWIHRLTPRGILKITLMMIIGAVLATWIFRNESLVKLVPAALAILLIPTAIFNMFEAFGRKGGEWSNVWPKRIAGAAVWMLVVGLITGLVHLPL